MFASIRHIAVMTENWDRMAKFYQTIFGMKKITNGMTDETGTYNKNRGHLSDGVIGLALLQRQPGFRSGLDHFGFAVESLADAKKDLAELAISFPLSAPKDIAGGVFGHITKEDMDGCRIGQYSLSDPDGIVLDLSERAAPGSTHSSAA